MVVPLELVDLQLRATTDEQQRRHHLLGLTNSGQHQLPGLANSPQ